MVGTIDRTFLEGSWEGSRRGLFREGKKIEC